MGGNSSSQTKVEMVATSGEAEDTWAINPSRKDTPAVSLKTAGSLSSRQNIGLETVYEDVTLATDITNFVHKESVESSKRSNHDTVEIIQDNNSSESRTSKSSSFKETSAAEESNDSDVQYDDRQSQEEIWRNNMNSYRTSLASQEVPERVADITVHRSMTVSVVDENQNNSGKSSSAIDDEDDQELLDDYNAILGTSMDNMYPAMRSYTHKPVDVPETLAERMQKQHYTRQVDPVLISDTGYIDKETEDWILAETSIEGFDAEKFKITNEMQKQSKALGSSNQNNDLEELFSGYETPPPKKSTTPEAIIYDTTEEDLIAEIEREYMDNT